MKNRMLFGYCDPVDYSLFVLGELNKIVLFKRRHSPNQVRKEIDSFKYETEDAFDYWIIINPRAYE